MLIQFLLLSSIVTSLLVDSILATHAMDLLEKVITGSTYKRLTPSNAPMQVSAFVQMLDIKDVNDLDETLSAVHRFTFYWWDSYYEWNPADYNNATYIQIPSTYLWTPDFAVLNEVTKIKQFDKDPSFIYLAGGYDGYHRCTPVVVSETRCKPDLLHYPYDTLECAIKIGTVSNTRKAVTFYRTSCENMEEATGTSTWRLERIEKEIKVEVFDKRLDFEHDVLYCVYHFKRKAEYVIYNTILPLVFLAILNSCSFIIPCSSGEKISYSMTLFLTFAVYVTIIMQSMPATSDSISYIQVYLISQLSMSVLIILVNSLQLRSKDILEQVMDKDDADDKIKEEQTKFLEQTKHMEDNYVGVISRKRLCKRIQGIFSLRTILPKIDLIGFVSVLILQMIFCTWYFVVVSSD